MDNSNKKIMKKYIRPIAICIFRKDNMIFIGEGYDSVKKEVFYRPFGGAIEFKEYSQDAIKREIMEELGQEITELTYLGMVENIFINEGKDGHEIVIIYEGQFQNKEMYDREPFDVFDDGNFCWKALWKPLEDFTVKGDKLYPEELLQMLINNCQLANK